MPDLKLIALDIDLRFDPKHKTSLTLQRKLKFRHAFIAVHQKATLTLFLDFSEFDSHRHADLDLLRLDISKLAEYLDIISQVDNRHRVGSLIDEWRGGHPDYRISFDFAGAVKIDFVEFPVSAFRADKPRRE